MVKRRRTKVVRQKASVVAPTLPNEMLDSIVGFLASDRRHHFKLLTKLSLMSRNWSSILAQLLDQCPAMCHWIHEIHIRYPTVFHFWEIFAPDSALKLERLENLRALYFDARKTFGRSVHNATWLLPPNQEAAFAKGLSKLTTIHELYILDTRVNMPHLSSLIRCLPSLRSISMTGYIQRISYWRMPPFSFSHVSLTHVHLNSIPLCHLMFPLLHDVRELRLDFGRYPMNAYVYGVVDEWQLENLRQVRTLILERVFSRDGDCFTVLRRLKELPVEDLIIKGTFSEPLKISHICDLAAALTSPGFPSLKRIRFIHQGGSTTEVIAQKLREALPVLRTREVALEVVKVKDINAYDLHE